MNDSTKVSNAERRTFVLNAARMGCGVSMLGLGLGLAVNQAKALPAQALRPPGAGSENAFLGACVRCGLCVRDCPPNILHLATPGQPVTTGTPFFVSRIGACEMCENVPCVKACPTGALDHGLTDIKKARMGLAVLVDKETCLNFLGLRCDVCYRVCHSSTRRSLWSCATTNEPISTLFSSRLCIRTRVRAVASASKPAS